MGQETGNSIRVALPIVDSAYSVVIAENREMYRRITSLGQDESVANNQGSV
jgi:hypothetical protein